MKKKLELLAPAKNKEYGIAAIDCGADAVYIGGPSFGARVAAKNSIDEIARLTEYAHQFNAKVFVTMNTLIYDNEINKAREIAAQIAEAGADALIVQDMAFAKIAPYNIPLHASTQCASLTPEKVKFLEDVGFKRVVLERALSIDEIASIRKNTSVELEAFVHGAICVCYSGQCYMSHAITGRSGNRGECSQPCRSLYSLVNDEGKRYLFNRRLLSVRDLSLENSLENLIDAGVTSFKIEGRLKDIVYLKNSVAKYNKALNDIISQKNEFIRASRGTINYNFYTDPRRSFSRGFTPYFSQNRYTKVALFTATEAPGVPIGKIIKIGKNFIELSTDEKFLPSDGICFVDDKGVIHGTNINVIEGKKLYPNDMAGLEVGLKLNRNFDKGFSDQLKSSKSVRQLHIDITAQFINNKLTLSTKGDIEVSISEEGFCDAVNQPQKMIAAINEQISRSGGTIFTVDKVDIIGELRFVPVSKLSTMRRELLELALIEIKAEYKRVDRPTLSPVKVVENGKLSYRANVVNNLSKTFYNDCGYSNIEEGVELKKDFSDIELMRTKYCILREAGMCKKDGGPTEQLYLENNHKLYRLEFDCVNCEMIVKK